MFTIICCKNIFELVIFKITIFSGNTINYLLKNKEYFVNENKKRVNELLRPGKPKALTDILGGVEGSFKKLDID